MGTSPSEFNKILRVFSLFTCALYNPHSFSLKDLQSYGYPLKTDASSDTIKKNKQRDIATLETLGISLVWDDSYKSGAYRVISHIFMRPFFLSPSEQQELAAVTNEIGRLPAQEQPHASVGLLRILHAHNQNCRRANQLIASQAWSSADNRSSWEAAQEISGELRAVIDDALERHAVISMKYAGGRRQGSYRKLYPHCYFMREDISYLSCYDYDAGENRCYRLDRILDIKATSERAEPQIVAESLAPHQLNTLPFQLGGAGTPYSVLFWPARTEHLHTNVSNRSQFYDVEAEVDGERVLGVVWNTTANSEVTLFKWLYEKVTDVQFAVLTQDGQVCSPLNYLNDFKKTVMALEQALSSSDGMPLNPSDVSAASVAPPYAVDAHTPPTPASSRKRYSAAQMLKRLFVPLCTLGLSRYQDELEMLIDAAADNFTDRHAVQKIVDQLRINYVQTCAEDLILMWRLLTALSERITAPEICDALQPEHELLNKFASLTLMTQEAQAVAHAFSLCQHGINSPLLQRIKTHAFSDESTLVVPLDVTEYLSFMDLSTCIETLTQAYHDNALVICEYTNQYRTTSMRKLHLASEPTMRNGVYYVDAYEHSGQQLKSYCLTRMRHITVSGLQAKKVPHLDRSAQTQVFQNLVDSSKPEVIPVIFAVDPRIARTIGTKVHACTPATKAALKQMFRHPAVNRQVNAHRKLLTIPWNTRSAWLPKYCAQMMGKIVGLHPEFLEQTAIELDLLMDAQPSSITFQPTGDTSDTSDTSALPRR